MAESNNSDTVINSNINIKKKKTKDYVLRAMYKYRNKKYAENPEFREQEQARCRDNYHKNKEKNKEKRALYMKEYYARKKREKEQAKLEQSSETEKTDTNTNVDNVVNSLDNLTIQSAVKAT